MTEEMNQALKEYNRRNTQLNQKNRAVSSWKTRMDRRTRFMKKQRGLQGKLEIRQRRAWASGNTRWPSILKTTTPGRGEAETEN